MIPGTQQPRAIVHLDLDAFFASVEVLENPALAGKPVIVGGSPEGRGVVASASYPARRFGIHSAMPTARALALCPQAIVVRSRHRLYWDYSRKVMTILREATPVLQQASVDEAFLDFSGQLAAWEDLVGIAQRLQARVNDETGLSASLGLATNKLVAKVASERDKPGGLTVVRPGEEERFLAPLSVRVLWGIGPVTARRLAQLGVTTVSDLTQLPEVELRKHFGRSGGHMARQARGIDTSPVVTERQAKSVSHETTFDRDLRDRATLEEHLLRLSQSVARRLVRSEVVASTLVVKVRYADFTTLSRQVTLTVPTDDAQEISRNAALLFYGVWQGHQAIRLLGVSARHLSMPVGQLRLL
jgi:DNA polymerase IV